MGVALEKESPKRSDRHSGKRWLRGQPYSQQTSSSLMTTRRNVYSPEPGPAAVRVYWSCGNEVHNRYSHAQPADGDGRHSANFLQGKWSERRQTGRRIRNIVCSRPSQINKIRCLLDKVRNSESKCPSICNRSRVFRSKYTSQFRAEVRTHQCAIYRSKRAHLAQMRGQTG